MAKAKPKLTTRQKENRKINRKRQWRKWWQTASRRFWIISVLLGSLSMGAGSWWFWHSGKLEQVVQNVSDRIWRDTAKLGFKVDHVYLEGRNYTPLPDITTALGIKNGDPILALSLSAMRARLEAIPRVKYAEIARTLPDQLHIRIVERQPIAVWQNESKLHLIDTDGVVMEYIDPKQYGQLLLVVGEDAPSHAHELLTALAASPELYKTIASATRVGERRWNIRFKNGALLKLPERNLSAAWQNFAHMEQDQHLLERDIKSVDMRLADRIFIKLPPAPEPKAERQGGSET